MLFCEKLTYVDSLYQAENQWFGKNKTVIQTNLDIQMPMLSIVFRYERLLDEKSNLKIGLFSQFTKKIGNFRQNL